MLKKIVITSLTGLVIYIGAFAQNMNPAEKINALLYLLQTRYVDTLNMEKVSEYAINGILKELDPHSYYLTAKELKEADEPLQGNFEGVGIQFNIYKDTILVVSPIPGGPSERVGIRSGDKIISIDDTIVAGKKITNNDVYKYLRGKKGTKVKVKIFRKSEKDLLEFVITRDKIPVFSVDASYMIAPGVGYIKINRFAGTTVGEFRQGMFDLKQQGMTDLILDLSDNTGGYLNAAVDLADEFLKSDEMIVYTKGEHSPTEKYKATAKGQFEEGKLVIIINEGSASASEIVSGAVQDLDRGVIVGRRSFGKGLVQNTFPFPDGSALRLTTARYYTPSGRFIQSPYEEGVEKYYEDLYSRYKNGELTDGHHTFPDSLKFYTRNKRTVYGGGGIMPDIFLPLDTTFYSDYLGDLNRKNIIYEFTIDYVDNYRSHLEAWYPDFDTFNEDFVITDELVREFVKYGDDKGVKEDPEGLKTSQEFLKMRLKAGIASTYFGRQGFFKVYNQYDETVQKAVEIITGKKYSSYLQPGKNN